ncbi:MAG: hypothetical protein FOGNACKC_03447 [Anaerolineae bacterium]|nr:hypothetical protein [Anaerolineae bacterium]
MRIIKLSTLEPNFETLATTAYYFECRLPEEFNRRFRMTAGRMRAGSPRSGEMLVFSRAGHIHYVAQAASTRQDNDDEWQDELPYFVEVDPASIRAVNLSLHELERRVHTETGITKSIVQSQGWPEVNAPAFEASLWEELTAG